MDDDPGDLPATALLGHVLRHLVGPRLRELGLRGTTQHWTLPNPARDYALLAFQRSRWNDSTEAQFTVNLRVTRRAQWQAAVAGSPWLGPRPSATAEGGPGWDSRLGMLLDPAVDRWWTLRSAADAPGVVDDVVHLVREVALPHLRARLADGQRPGPYAWPALPRDD